VAKVLPFVKPDRNKPPKHSKKMQAALNAAHELYVAGKPVTHQEVSAKAGVGRHTAQRALHIFAAVPVPPIDVATQPPSTRMRLEAWKLQERRRLRQEVEAELRAQYDFSTDEWLRHLNEFLDEAKKVQAAYDGIMPRREYLAIVKCLHPDTQPGAELKTEAFRLFTRHEKVLVKQERKFASSVPMTVAELLQRRKNLKEMKDANRS
jgi:hypothetical protein